MHYVLSFLIDVVAEEEVVGQRGKAVPAEQAQQIAALIVLFSSSIHE